MKIDAERRESVRDQEASTTERGCCQAHTPAGYRPLVSSHMQAYISLTRPMLALHLCARGENGGTTRSTILMSPIPQSGRSLASSSSMPFTPAHTCQSCTISLAIACRKGRRRRERVVLGLAGRMQMVGKGVAHLQDFCQHNSTSCCVNIHAMPSHMHRAISRNTHIMRRRTIKSMDQEWTSEWFVL